MAPMQINRAITSKTPTVASSFFKSASNPAPSRTFFTSISPQAQSGPTSSQTGSKFKNFTVAFGRAIVDNSPMLFVYAAIIGVGSYLDEQERSKSNPPPRPPSTSN